jgi:hypothetical protein
MTKAEAHNCAMTLVTEMIKTGKPTTLSGKDAKEVAKNQADQLKTLYDELAAHFAKVDLEGK